VPEGVVAQERGDAGACALARGGDHGVRHVAAEARQVEPLAPALHLRELHQGLAEGQDIEGLAHGRTIPAGTAA
jgi:hypothetical protein